MKVEEMKRKNKRLILIILLLVISLGYALLNATLTINGNSKITAQTWDIHWNNVLVTNGSVAIGSGDRAASITSGDTTEVTYEVSLSKPGDFYEFTVDAVNAGTVDAMIDEIRSTYKIGEGEVTTITSSNLPAYLDYSVSYSDGKALAQYQELKANTTETYKVRVSYKKDISENDLPATAQSIVFNFAVEYVQADSNATAVQRGFTRTIYSNDFLSIDEEFPTSQEYFESATELSANLDANIYFKYIIENDIVKEAYLGFIVTDNMVANNEGMVAGTYALRGIDKYNFDDNTGDDVCKAEYEDGNGNCISPYYESNVNILKTAFGYNTHPERCGTDGQAENGSLEFFCNVSGLGLTTHLGGEVSGGDGSYHNLIYDFGAAGCWD